MNNFTFKYYYLSVYNRMELIIFEFNINNENINLNYISKVKHKN